MLNQMISCLANIKVLIRLLLAAARNMPVALFCFFFCEPKRIYIAHGSTVQTIFIRNTLENKKLQSNHFQGHEKTPDSAAVHRNSNLGRRGIGR
jgi:hypothetical protein